MRPAGDAVRVLVTDGEQRAALAVVRSLGGAGCSVSVCSSRPHAISGASRHARRHTLVPDPLREPERYSAEVLRAAEEWDAQVVLPVAEASILSILPNREQFRAILPLPDLQTFARASDKAYVAGLAGTLGLSVPAQYVLNAAGDLESAASQLHFPVVVKPSRSVIGTEAGRIKTGVAYATSAEMLTTLGERLHADAFPLLLQERIEGSGMGAFLLRWNGEIIASFCHRRLREKPPSGGVSVHCESVAPDPALLQPAAALLAALDWQGIAMVEYKLDSRTATPYLMEINGRFWGSLQLAVDAGVNFPLLLVDAALGRRPPHVHHYRAGIRSRWFWGDVDHLLMRFRRSAGELSLPSGAPHRLAALGDFLAGFDPRSRSEVLRIADPRPGIVEAVNWLRRR
jgi:predicted ATP-grasp superfamily ATP-dependent carboligase